MRIFIICFLATFVASSNSLFGQEISPADLHDIMHNEHAGHQHFKSHPEAINYKVVDKTLEVYIRYAADTMLDDHEIEGLVESFAPLLGETGTDNLEVKLSFGSSEYREISYHLRDTEELNYQFAKNEDPFPNNIAENRSINPHLGQGQPSGALSGKTVWLSPGHGYLNDDNNSTWTTQRGNTHDMVEDFGTIGGVDYFLQKYLHNAGANVWIVRERDVNTNEVIVDNDDGAPSYTETGSWSTSSSTGYDGGTYRFTNTNAQETATAIYTPIIPEAGWYWVSLYFRNGANRVADLSIKIQHAGGETVVSLDQEVHGLTWNYVGEFYFDAGTTGQVIMSNESNEFSQAVIADAVRFGGGIGNEPDCTYGGTVSGKPRFDECARQYALYQGYPTCESDVVIRPKYAEWELAKGTTTEQANAVYLSWHTNAFNGAARGTETYSYNGGGSNPITPGSSDLRNFVHAELVDYIKTFYDPSWSDRGTKTANFGELRELTTMPGTLVEVAFHDNADDADALKTPYFRDLAARAMYHGILKFFNDRDGSPLIKSPAVPEQISAIAQGDGTIQVSWATPSIDISYEAATGYKVYMSTHGKGFDNGTTVTSGTSLDVSNLDVSKTYYFQVSAFNDGGESFPSSTVACRMEHSDSYVKYLLVDGFNRLDRASSIVQNNDPNLGTIDRMFLERMNRYDYMVDHAKALESCNYHFDGMDNEAVIQQSNLADSYPGIDWILGEESTVDNTLDANEQNLLTSYLNNGGNLVISGAEIGWDLGRSSSPNASVSFYNNYLKTVYVADDANSYSYAGISGTDFDGLSGNFDDATNGYYNVEFPDRLAPSSGASLLIDYVGGSGDGAAVGYKGTDFGVVNFGFPIETVYNETVRNDLLCAALNYLTPNLCETIIDVDNAYDPTENIINAAERIDSDRNVFGLNSISYLAGDTICLMSGFDTANGLIFSAEIQPCPDQ